MTRHVWLRLTSSVLLIAVVFFQLPAAALAIVCSEEMILARGFGVGGIEKKTPVTPDTPFLIGSATKAFTAPLVAMLVDEGRMPWDDPVEKYLPKYKLAGRSNDPKTGTTLRDLLSHRTGLTRTGFLEIIRGLSPDEILRRASSVEALAPFRQRFLYNHVHYPAAGSASGVAAGTSWHALMQERLLAPLAATTCSDYREVGGMRVPHLHIESTVVGGRMIFQVERVEVSVELAPDTFKLHPSTESGWGK